MLRLDPSRDYLVRVSRDKGPRRKGLIVQGGHNVVIVGGQIRIGWQGKQPNHNDRRGLLLKDQTGVVHVEGLKIGGRDLGEGIDLDQRKGATVQLVNVHIGTVRDGDERNFGDTHPDLVQSWAGPRRLRIDGLRGRTGYQGLFLLPRQFQGDLDVREIDLRNISITGTRRRATSCGSTAARAGAAQRVVRARRPRRRQLLWPRPQNWSGAASPAARPAICRRPAAGGAYAVPSKHEEGRPWSRLSEPSPGPCARTAPWSSPTRSAAPACAPATPACAARDRPVALRGRHAAHRALARPPRPRTDRAEPAVVSWCGLRVHADRRAARARQPADLVRAQGQPTWRLFLPLHARSPAAPRSCS